MQTQEFLKVDQLIENNNTGISNPEIYFDINQNIYQIKELLEYALEDLLGITIYEISDINFKRNSDYIDFIDIKVISVLGDYFRVFLKTIPNNSQLERIYNQTAKDYLRVILEEKPQDSIEFVEVLISEKNQFDDSQNYHRLMNSLVNGKTSILHHYQTIFWSVLR